MTEINNTFQKLRALFQEYEAYMDPKNIIFKEAWQPIIKDEILALIAKAKDE